MTRELRIIDQGNGPEIVLEDEDMKEMGFKDEDTLSYTVMDGIVVLRKKPETLEDDRRHDDK